MSKKAQSGADKASAPKRKSGGQSKYTPEIGTAICAALAGGKSLAEAAASYGVGSTTFLSWCSRHAELDEEYARARIDQNESVDDELRALAETVTPENARAVETKFRMITWIAGKRSSKRFGDRVGLEHSGPNGGPIQVDLAERLARLRAAAKPKS